MQLAELLLDRSDVLEQAGATRPVVKKSTHPNQKEEEEEVGVIICAFLGKLKLSCFELALAGWLPALPHSRPQMADTQQFFTGKLYVPVHMLKLPAEELLWSALPRMTQEEEEDVGFWE